MAFKSETYQILIASPSDLTVERKIVVEAIDDWNAQHAMAEGVVLLPVMWETHSMPQSNVRPQDAINTQIVRMCDILLGIFWTKIGTNTGAAESGTVEEIDQFVKAGKPALLYFSDCPIAPSKIDLRQQEKLNDFKEETRKKALIGTFEEHNELRKKLVRDLLRQIRGLKQKTRLSPEPQVKDEQLSVEQIAVAEREIDYSARDRMKEALLDVRFKWRTLKAVAGAAGLPEQQVEKVIHLLRLDPSVRFTTDKNGAVLVGLRSRVDRVEGPRSSYPEHGDRWGNWEFDAEKLELTYSALGRRYEIDLAGIDSSAEMLDWIFQMATKGWVTREDLGNLILAFEDLMHPQGNLCSGGADHRIDPVSFFKEQLTLPKEN